MTTEHLDIFTLAERLHRKFLDLIQIELDRRNIRDINSVRALILLNLRESELTVSDLMYSGCYLGSNVSYNLKKLTDAGYIHQTRSVNDRRVIMVKNSNKAIQLCKELFEATTKDSTAMMNDATKADDLATCHRSLRLIEHSCMRAIERRGREAAARLVA